ncbi:MAG: hypothetical protein M0R40_11425 [Firmicutes bacterium]|nr:hypothetical protein [Bacillota bacterium]
MNNEDKILTMLETLVEGQLKTDNRLDNLESRFDTFENILLRMEHDHGQKLQMLLDAHDANIKSHQQLENRTAKLETTVEKHSAEIAAIQVIS